MNDDRLAVHQFGTPGLHIENSALTRSEYITALVHFYRAEMHRATVWRVRLDTTTNWAIVTTMAVVTFTFGDATHSHASLLAGMLMVATFLGIEARRFRIFDVWRERTRMLELNFMSPILRGDLSVSRLDWSRQAAEHLDRPSYTLTWPQAVRSRLVRNYLPLFALLLACWTVKLARTANHDLENPRRWLDAMRMGPIPGEVALAVVVLMYGALLAVILLAKSVRSEAEELAPPKIEGAAGAAALH